MVGFHFVRKSHFFPCVTTKNLLFFTHSIALSISCTNDELLLKVELFGKTDNEKCNRICVVSDFFRQGMPYYDYDRNIYDARQQKLYESYDVNCSDV